MIEGKIKRIYVGATLIYEDKSDVESDEVDSGLTQTQQDELV